MNGKQSRKLRKKVKAPKTTFGYFVHEITVSRKKSGLDGLQGLSEMVTLKKHQSYTKGARREYQDSKKGVVT